MVVCGDAFVTLPWFVLAWEFSLIVSISEKMCRCVSGFVCMCCYVSLWEWICGCVGVRGLCHGLSWIGSFL